MATVPVQIVRKLKPTYTTSNWGLQVTKSQHRNYLSVTRIPRSGRVFSVHTGGPGFDSPSMNGDPQAKKSVYHSVPIFHTTAFDEEEEVWGGGGLWVSSVDKSAQSVVDHL